MYFFRNYAAIFDNKDLLLLDSASAKIIKRFKNFHHFIFSFNGELYAVKDSKLYKLSQKAKEFVMIAQDKIFSGSPTDQFLSWNRGGYLLADIGGLGDDIFVSHELYKNMKESPCETLSAYNLTSRKVVWSRKTCDGDLGEFQRFEILENKIVLWEEQEFTLLSPKDGTNIEVTPFLKYEIPQASSKIPILGGASGNQSLATTPCKLSIRQYDYGIVCQNKSFRSLYILNDSASGSISIETTKK